MVQRLLFVLCALNTFCYNTAWMIPKPQCPPLPARCRFDSSYFDENYYFVEGMHVKVYIYIEGADMILESLHVLDT